MGRPIRLEVVRIVSYRRGLGKIPCNWFWGCKQMVNAVDVMVAGAGYVGTALVRAMAPSDWSWRAVRRSIGAEPRGVSSGGSWLIADLDHPDDCARLAQMRARFWVYLAPAAERRSGVDQRLRGVLAALATNPPERLIYASTTGVYGNQNGAVVTEDSPLNAASERGKVRVDAEQAVLEAASRWQCGWNILRLPGIYGPGRLRLDAVRAGTPVLCPELAPPGNRVHRDDIVSAILLLLRQDGPVNGAVNGVFNLADREHATSTGFVYAVADELGVARPPCIDDLESYYEQFPGMASFLRERRRVDSSRARQLLGWVPRYDTSADGIAASMAEGVDANRI